LTLRRGGRGAALATAARTAATETAAALRGSATLTFRLRRAGLARGLWLLLLRLRLRRGSFTTTTAASTAAATAATTIAAARLLFTGGLLWLCDDCRTRFPLAARLRRTLIALLVTLFATFTRLLLLFLAARLLRTSFRSRRSSARTTIFFRHAASRPLLELLHFLLHELPALRVEFCAQRVVAAVGAALPSVRM